MVKPPVLRDCAICGEQMVLSGYTTRRKVCSKIECKRKRAAQVQAAWIRANPERAKAIRDKLFATQHFKDYQRNWRSVPCVNCGKPVSRVNTYEERRCVKCSGLLKRQRVEVVCYWCGLPLERKLSAAYDKCYHSECFGVCVRKGKEWGLTHERIRQLVNKEQAYRGGTKAEALVRVEEIRKYSPSVHTMTPEEESQWVKDYSSLTFALPTTFLDV